MFLYRYTHRIAERKKLKSTQVFSLFHSFSWKINIFIFWIKSRQSIENPLTIFTLIKKLCSGWMTLPYHLKWHSIKTYYGSSITVWILKNDSKTNSIRINRERERRVCGMKDYKKKWNYPSSFFKFVNKSKWIIVK